MRAYGVSVETVDEALAAIARPRVASVQIVLDAFRQRPLEQVLPAALDAGVGVADQRVVRPVAGRSAKVGGE